MRAVIIFSAYFVACLTAWHLLRAISYRRELSKAQIYELAAGLGAAVFGLFRLAGAIDCLLYHWPITLGVTMVSILLYDQLQWRLR